MIKNLFKSHQNEDAQSNPRQRNCLTSTNWPPLEKSSTFSLTVDPFRDCTGLNNRINKSTAPEQRPGARHVIERSFEKSALLSITRANYAHTVTCYTMVMVSMGLREQMGCDFCSYVRECEKNLN